MHTITKRATITLTIDFSVYITIMLLPRVNYYHVIFTINYYTKMYPCLYQY